jgi:hypothetical protein
MSAMQITAVPQSRCAHSPCAAIHSITSSARPSSGSGTLRPSATASTHALALRGCEAGSNDVDQQLDRKPSASSWTGGTDGVACAHGNGTPSNRKSASGYRRPQPHSQVMDNGIATSSLAVDLLWETRVYRGCLRWLRFASVEKRPPHRLNGQRLAKVLPIRRSSGGSPQATNLLCERSSHGIGWRCIGGCCTS